MQMNLDHLASSANATSKRNGFWQEQFDDNVLGTKLALVHSEVTEALEARRKDQGDEAFVNELADIIIRVIDLWGGMQAAGEELPSLHEAMLEKLRVNETRAYKHGNRF